MDTHVFTVETGANRGTFDITGIVADYVADKGDGLVSLFVPHATAGLAVFEAGAGSDLDFIDTLDRLVPRDETLYRHRHGSPGHGADHVIPGFVAPSMTVPVAAGQLLLGTWQSIMLVDTNVDNPQRQVRVSFIAG